MIYLDNAATTRTKPQCVIDAVVRAMTGMGNAARGTHESALDAARVIYDARCRVAQLFGCEREDHVIFTCNATEALNIAINGSLTPEDHVITTDLEHNSVLRPLYALQEQGMRLDFVRADEKGNVEEADFERLIRPDTRAIVCTHASNLTGNALNLERIGAIAAKYHLLFIVDASQSAGHLPVDMRTQKMDVLCFTGHKGLMGPQGTGGLCIRPGVELRPMKRGGTGVHSYDRNQPSAYPTRLEAGTLNGHGLAGLHAALGFLAETGIDKIREKEHRLMRRFQEGVREIPEVKIYGDFETGLRTAVVSLNIREYDSGAVADELAREYGIAVRAGAHCAPRMHQALGTAEQGAVRFSFSWFNTEQEIDTAIEAVRRIAAL